MSVYRTIGPLVICNFLIKLVRPFTHFKIFLMNGFTSHYHLGVSTSLGVIFNFYLIFLKFLCGNRIALVGTPRSATSHLGLYCLPMSHNRNARHTCVKAMSVLYIWNSGLK